MTKEEQCMPKEKRDNEAPPQTVTHLIESVCSEICDNYCKFPELYGSDDEAFDKLMQEHCNDCPLNRL